MHIRHSFVLIVSVLLSISVVPRSTATTTTFPTGEITGFGYQHPLRMWADWTCSDINNDGWREIMIVGAIFSECYDVNPAHGGPIRLWSQWGLHHEAFWGCDSGIDVNGDNITEQLIFESVWNIHYLVYGNNGTAVPTAQGNDRRYTMFWPSVDCGTGLNGTDVNGNGIDDYVIVGLEQFTGIPTLHCIEGINGSVIWSSALAGVANGVRLVTAGGGMRILTYGVSNQLWYTNGTLAMNLASGYVCVIPGGSGHGDDMALINSVAYNLTNNAPMWTAAIWIGSPQFCGDVDGNGIGDYSGLWPDGKKAGIFSGVDGTLIRNHTAQHTYNVLHGVISVGDIDNDGRGDYAIYGDIAPCEVFSGATGNSILQVEIGEGVEELYPVPDVNGNGHGDIMTFDGGCCILDGTARGYIKPVFVDLGEINNGPGGSGPWQWGTFLDGLGIGIIACIGAVIVAMVIRKRKRKSSVG